MILLDTNVLSELTRKEPEPAVIAWLNRQPAMSLWTTSISIFEARFGLLTMATGKQRSYLELAFEVFCSDVLENRILSFDTVAAQETASLMAARRKRGFSVDLRDTMIAGIVLASRATLATRNTRHFRDLRVAVVNPWEARA